MLWYRLRTAGGGRGGHGSWFVSGLVHGRQVRLVQTSVPFANDVLLTKQRAARKRKQRSRNAVIGSGQCAG